MDKLKEIRLVMQDMENQSDRQMQRSFRHLRWSMLVIGALFIPGKPHDPASSKCSLLQVYTKFFHTYGHFIVWALTLKYFFAYEYNDGLNVSIMLKLIEHANLLKCVICFIICFKLSRLWHRLFDTWHKYRLEYKISGSRAKRSYKRVAIATILAWIFTISSYTYFFTTSIAWYDSDSTAATKAYLEPLPRFTEVTKGLFILSLLQNYDIDCSYICHGIACLYLHGFEG